MRMCSSLDRHSVILLGKKKKVESAGARPHLRAEMEGFLRADTFLVMSFVGVMFWDKGGGGVGQGKRRKRKMEGEGLLPVSKWRTLVSKSGQDGRNGTNRAPERGVWTWARGTQTKLIVFMLLDFWVDAGCVCWFVSTFFFLPQEFSSRAVWIHLRWVLET